MSEIIELVIETRTIQKKPSILYSVKAPYSTFEVDFKLRYIDLVDFAIEYKPDFNLDEFRETFGEYEWDAMYRSIGYTSSWIKINTSPDCNELSSVLYRAGLFDCILKDKILCAEFCNWWIKRKAQEYASKKSNYTSNTERVVASINVTGVSDSGLIDEKWNFETMTPQLETIGDEVYEVTRKKVDADFKNIVHENSSAIAESLNRRIENILTNYNKEMRNMRELLDKQTSDAFKQGIILSKRIQDEGWEINSDCIIYPKKINVEKIIKNDRLYDVTKCKKEIFVNDLIIPIKSVIKNIWSTGGFHPNMSTTAETVEGLEDTRLYNVCIGELAGKSLLEVITKIKDNIKVVNLDSPLADGNSYVRKYVAGHVGYLKSKGLVTESWDDNSWY